MSAIQKLLENKRNESGGGVGSGQETAVMEAAAAEREHLNITAGGKSESVVVVVSPSTSAQAGDQQQQKRQDEQKSDANSHRTSILTRVFSRTKSKSPEKKFLDEFVIEEEGSKLPMVKFDSDGDFFKEPLESAPKIF